MSRLTTRKCIRTTNVTSYGYNGYSHHHHQLILFRSEILKYCVSSLPMAEKRAFENLDWRYLRHMFVNICVSYFGRSLDVRKYVGRISMYSSTTYR